MGEFCFEKYSIWFEKGPVGLEIVKGKSLGFIGLCGLQCFMGGEHRRNGWPLFASECRCSVDHKRFSASVSRFASQNAVIDDRAECWRRVGVLRAERSGND